jgi:glycosyltransferase involved in cell wall biosynthesis
MREAGFDVLDWPLVRESMNPARELAAVLRLAAIYTKATPDVVHHFTVKPNVYGALAVRLLGNCSCAVINTFTGLGHLFSRALRARALRASIWPALRLALRGERNWTVLQTRSDLETLVRSGLIRRDRARLIPGSGVDIDRFRPNPTLGRRTPVVLTAARLLWDKGIADLVESARILSREGVAAEFWIAGARDSGNPSCIPAGLIDRWQKDGPVRFLGHEPCIDRLLARSDIAALPSYHEGVPRFLLESAAAGLPLVASDLEGCRTVIHPGANGLLVPPRRPEALARAIRILIDDPGLRMRYGRASRRIAEEQSEEKIIAQYLRLYEEVGMSIQGE